MRIKEDEMLVKMSNGELMAEYESVQARLAEIEPFIEPALQPEIDSLREYAATIKGTVLSR